MANLLKMWIWVWLGIILKTIGNRKGDCAWSCSRWQTQPEKICKSQRTNQCHSLRTLYWFVLCNLQIFSGCVCPLEQLHAQSPFLFPIAFSINLIPFFDIKFCSVLAVLSPGLFGFVLLYLGRCAVATVGVFCCGFGRWFLVFHCGLPRQISPLPRIPQSPLKQTCAGESIQDRRLFTIQCSPRISTSYKFAVPRNRLPCRLFRLSVKPRLSTALKDRSVVPWS